MNSSSLYSPPVFGEAHHLESDDPYHSCCDAREPVTRYLSTTSQSIGPASRVMGISPPSSLKSSTLRRRGNRSQSPTRTLSQASTMINKLPPTPTPSHSLRVHQCEWLRISTLEAFHTFPIDRWGTGANVIEATSSDFDTERHFYALCQSPVPLDLCLYPSLI